MIKSTRKDYQDRQFVVGNVLNLPFKDSSLDLIVCLGLIEYISEIEFVLNQIRTALRQKKYLLISNSPKSILTSMRIVNGHKIYARDTDIVQNHFKKYQFRILDIKDTPMQNQYLLKKE
jgi:ubiquinone/menaquinone biosynthesis C-methylase UbiE